MNPDPYWRAFERGEQFATEMDFSQPRAYAHAFATGYVEAGKDLREAVAKRQVSGDGHRREVWPDEKTVVCDMCLLRWPCDFEKGRMAVLNQLGEAIPRD